MGLWHGLWYLDLRCWTGFGPGITTTLRFFSLRKPVDVWNWWRSLLSVEPLPGSCLILRIVVHAPLWLQFTSAKISSKSATSRHQSGWRRTTDKWLTDEHRIRKAPIDCSEWRQLKVQGAEQLTSGAGASTDGRGEQGSGKKKKYSVNSNTMGNNVHYRFQHTTHHVMHSDCWILYRPLWSMFNDDVRHVQTGRS